MRFVILMLTMLWAAGAALADGRRFMDAEEAAQWRAVGRINIAGLGFCTGAMIAPDLVLTAAHCLYHPRSERQVTADRVYFLAGWRLGQAFAERRVERVHLHPDYVFAGPRGRSHIETDIAVLQLTAPINTIVPFEVVGFPTAGRDLAVVSYARDRSEAPSRQEGCQPLGVDGDVLVMNCDAVGGVSGSPVFVDGDQGPQIAAIISAIRQQGDQKLAYGMRLTGEFLREFLPPLKDRF